MKMWLNDIKIIRETKDYVYFMQKMSFFAYAVIYEKKWYWYDTDEYYMFRINLKIYDRQDKILFWIIIIANKNERLYFILDYKFNFKNKYFIYWKKLLK